MIKYDKNYLISDSLDEDEEEIRKYYKRKIYLKDTPKNIDDVILKLISLDNATYYSRGGTHCEVMKLRSIHDIYKVCLSYFPNTKLKEVIDKLQFVKTEPYNNVFGYCSVIKKYRVGFGKPITQNYKKANGIKD